MAGCRHRPGTGLVRWPVAASAALAPGILSDVGIDRRSRVLFPEALFSFDPAGGGIARRLRGQWGAQALESAGKKNQTWRLAGLVLRTDGGDNDHDQERYLVRKNTRANCAHHLGRRSLAGIGDHCQYIRNHSGPDALVAVLGSEPEIYFLAHRHSATGYIYTYA